MRSFRDAPPVNDAYIKELAHEARIMQRLIEHAFIRMGFCRIRPLIFGYALTKPIELSLYQVRLDAFLYEIPIARRNVMDDGWAFVLPWHLSVEQLSSLEVVSELSAVLQREVAFEKLDRRPGFTLLLKVSRRTETQNLAVDLYP